LISFDVGYFVLFKLLKQKCLNCFFLFLISNISWFWYFAWILFTTIYQCRCFEYANNFCDFSFQISNQCQNYATCITGSCFKGRRVSGEENFKIM